MQLQTFILLMYYLNINRKKIKILSVWIKLNYDFHSFIPDKCHGI